MAEREPFVLSGSQQRVRPLKMSDQVAAQIRKMIARGELVDGDWLPTEAELIEHCRATIASYKKPRTVVFVDALPRDGWAVDYAALDEQFGGGGYPGAG